MNNSESKHDLLMKFDQLMSYYKKKLWKNYIKASIWTLVSRPFCVCKELSTTSIGKLNF